MLVAERPETALPPRLPGDEPEEPRHEGLDRESIDDEDEAEGRRKDRRCQAAQERRREPHGPKNPSPHVRAAGEIRREEHHVGYEGGEREQSYREHRSSSDRQAVRLRVE